jgi:hypothetical protein
VLTLLLRALLIVSVVFSVAATVRVCGWAFTHLSGFAGRRPGPFPLFAFVFPRRPGHRRQYSS